MKYKYESKSLKRPNNAFLLLVLHSYQKQPTRAPSSLFGKCETEKAEAPPSHGRLLHHPVQPPDLSVTATGVQGEAGTFSLRK